MRSINIVHGSKKKNMETCTLKLNIRENRILLSTGGGATCHHYAYFNYVFLLFINKNFWVMLLMVTHSKVIHSKIN